MHQLQTRSRPKAKPGTVLCICFLLGWATLTVTAKETNYPQPKNFNSTESPVTDLLSQKSISELFQDFSEDQERSIWLATSPGVLLKCNAPYFGASFKDSDGKLYFGGKTLAVDVSYINIYPPAWFRWWAFTFYGSFLVCLAVLIRKFYDTYQQQEQATEFSAEMHNTAELAMDDLEDQLEMEQVLVHNLHNHAESTLKLVSGLLERQAESIDDDVILDAFEDSQQRLACLQLLENNMLYTAQFLEIDFQKFLEDLFAQIFPLDTPPELEVVPVNDAPDQILAVAIAVPAALIANELVMNSARHAFEGARGMQTVCVHMQEKRQRNGWVLEVSDSGSGLPAEIDPHNPTTTGMEIVSRFSRELNAVVTVNRDKGTRFRFEIPRLKPDHSDS